MNYFRNFVFKKKKKLNDFNVLGTLVEREILDKPKLVEGPACNYQITLNK